MNLPTHPDSEALVLTSVAGTEARLAIAGIGARSYAFIVDWHIRLLLAVVWFASFGFFLASTAAPTLWLMWLPSTALYLLYHPFLETLTGTTPGKRMAAIRIVTQAGLRPSVSAMLVRNLLRLVDTLPGFYTLGLLTAMMDNRSRRLGDMAAGTLLVRADTGIMEVFNALDARSGSSLEPQLAEITADLLQRWQTLAPARRKALGLQVLTLTGGPLPPEAEADEASLLARLRNCNGAHQ